MPFNSARKISFTDSRAAEDIFDGLTVWQSVIEVLLCLKLRQYCPQNY